MLALTLLLAAILGLLAWSRAIAWMYRVRLGADGCIFADTDDGWRLALWRYRAQGPPKDDPVLLVPGMGSNRYSFDLGPDAPSLARTLSAHGFDVYVAELRGHGASDDGPAYGGWTFDDYVLHDAPALLAAIRRETGSETVHCVGHSMGGILVLSLLARGVGGIRSAITLGSSLDYTTVPGFRPAKRMRPLLRRLPAAPIGLPFRLIAPLAGRVDNAFERFDMWVPNVEPLHARRLNAVTFNRSSAGVLLQLSSALEPGGLRTADESGPSYLELLHRQPELPPVLMLAGDRDEQCTAEALASTAGDRPEITVRLVGRVAGHAEHYGHFDTLMGRRAETEIFPQICQWLEAHDEQPTLLAIDDAP